MLTLSSCARVSAKTYCDHRDFIHVNDDAYVMRVSIGCSMWFVP